MLYEHAKALLPEAIFFIKYARQRDQFSSLKHHEQPFSLIAQQLLDIRMISPQNVTNVAINISNPFNMAFEPQIGSFTSNKVNTIFF